MNNNIKLLILGLLCLFSSNAHSRSGSNNLPELEIDEMIMEEDPYVGITIDMEQFPYMVSMSNITKEIYPSKYVQNIDRFITSLARSRNAEKNLFKNKKKKIEFLDSKDRFEITQVLKTAVYKGNSPDEYTTYIIKDSKGTLYAIPEIELKEVSKIELSSYEKSLIEELVRQGGKAKVVIYFEKPPAYSDKKPPFRKKNLDSVFDFFLSNISGYSYEGVLKSNRNFRLSMIIPADTLAFIISEYDRLYIEDLEIISK
ncbi:MAG: hypothetical protein GY793_02095 [Proteobacteria bacterium]|nr:hypothetical protein [Pseudomonadota bacterium]